MRQLSTIHTNTLGMTCVNIISFPVYDTRGAAFVGKITALCVTLLHSTVTKARIRKSLKSRLGKEGRLLSSGVLADGMLLVH